MVYIYVVLIILIILFFVRMSYKKNLAKICEIKDALLVPEELKKHAQDLARNHTVTKHTNLSSWLIPRLNDNYKFIKMTYNTLNHVINNEKPVNPAAEWLLDNFYIIEEQLRDIRKSLSKGYYSSLPGLKNGILKGYPRIFSIALEIVSHTDGRLDEETIINFIKSYQLQTILKIGELWALNLMLRIALFENIRRICEKILIAQKQWEKAENTYAKIGLKIDKPSYELLKIMGAEMKDGDRLNTAYIEHMLQSLRKRGREAAYIVKYIEKILAENDMDLESLARIEHQMQASLQVSIGNSITSIRLITSMDWANIFEKLSHVDQILKADPAGIYQDMDFASRDYYRHVIEYLSKAYDISETQIARCAISCASGEFNDDDIRKKHVGYYLVSYGIKELEKNISKRLKGRYRIIRFIKNHPGFAYIGSILSLSFIIDALFTYYAYINGNSIYNIVLLAILLFIASSDISVNIINWLGGKIFLTTLIPKIELKNGIPAGAETFVVIPTLITSKDQVNELISRIETYYLANKQKGLYFGILGDFKDCKDEILPTDEDIVKYILLQIKKLNKKYCAENEKDIFFYFSRKRTFIEKQNEWMGWERKRGALIEFNKLLRGDENTGYVYTSCDIKDIPHVKYVITLDADTELTFDTAKALVGTMLHPLNKPIIDEDKNIVIQGYGLLQPRIGISIVSANVSLFSRIFSGQSGIDPYTTAIFDIYQDLFGEGIYTGKGIYDVDVFMKVLDERFPDNSILSHDLLEGAYVRAGLVSDIQFIDGYPSKYNSYAMRLHRWVRGDWQLLPWLKKTVKDRNDNKVKNPISAISKWKIIDNLRRSLTTPSLFLLIVLGLLFLKGSIYLWFCLVLLIMAFPVLLSLINVIVTDDELLHRGKRHSKLFYGAGSLLYQTLLLFVFMPYQAYLMIDAILKTIYRVYITKRNLIEWVTASDMEKRLKNDPKSFYKRMWVSIAMASIIFFLAIFLDRTSIFISFILLSIWIISPFIAYVVSRPIVYKRFQPTNEDIAKLRRIARKTWRYFEDFVSIKDNFLPPDNYQEYPHNGLAHRTSPTNIGLYFNAILAARDFGYISLKDMLDRIENTLTTVEKMDKWRGHLYNWYNTQNLKPLRPLYVSTVDSGNFIGYLITLKQGLNMIKESDVYYKNYARGLIDTLELLREDVDYKNINIEKLRDVIKSNNFYDWISALKDIKLQLIEVFNKKGDSFSPWLDKAMYMTDSFSNEIREFGLSSDGLSSDRFTSDGDLSDLIKDIDKKPDEFKNVVHDMLRNINSKSFEDLLTYLNNLCESELNEAENISVEDKERILSVKDKISHSINCYINRIDNLTSRLENIINLTNFKPLYVPQRQLFSIGYNVEDESLTKSYYDLLASEARQTSFIAIARGEVSIKNWFRLGRSLTEINGYTGLASWTGTMFEYLMPYLIMKNYDNTLLDETYHFVVMAQKEYAKMKKVPWGSSESGFYAFDLNLNYQYKAFGVPLLGLKRGLSNDLVIAPYATLLALNIEPEESIKNLDKLNECGLEGQYGYYEAIDFTFSRLREGETYNIVKSYMVHHQGMSFMAIDNYLNNNIMQQRFHSDPVMKAADILLQERIPIGVTYTNKIELKNRPFKKPYKEETEIVRTTGIKYKELPDVHLLSNGNYSLMLTDKGTGYSKTSNLAVTRWRNDSMADYGIFFYIRNVNSNEIWSAAFAPLNAKTNKYRAVFSQDKAEYFRTDGSIDTHMEVIVSPSDNAEIRRISLTNHSRHVRDVEITSYLEVVLAYQGADEAHPAFSNLFIKTEYVNECSALLATRRQRNIDDKQMWMMHNMTVEGTPLSDIQYETDRYKFIGRGRTKSNPLVMETDHPLSNTTGAVLDPIMSLRRRIRIEPGQTVRISFTTAVAESRDEVLELAEKYHEKSSIERAFELAWTRSKVENKYLSIKASDIELYQQMLPKILFTGTNPFKRKYDESLDIQKGQSSLWYFGISGDLPIVLLCIENTDDIEIVHKMLRAHEYWRIRGLNVDLVILNEDKSGYMQPLRDVIRDAIFGSNSRDLYGKNGGIFVIQSADMSDDDKKLFYLAAKIVLKGGNGPIKEQLKSNENETVIKEKPECTPLKYSIKEYKTLERPDMQFYNDLGGFYDNGREYIIYLSKGKHTPAPWINVISNGKFGFQISEAGSGYTWAENSRENKLTPWSNDPIQDTPGEIIYLSDIERKNIWTITSKPIYENEPYLIKHGQGYSVFEHISHGISQKMTVFVPVNDNVKVYIITLRNLTDTLRKISLTYYIRPVLGVNDDKTSNYIISDVIKDGNILILKNPYNEDFPGRICFMDASIDDKINSADRLSFFGSGSTAMPESLRKDSIKQKWGPGLDPCGVVSVRTDIIAGEEKSIVFILGQEKTIEKVKEISSKYKDVKTAFKELENVKEFWNKKLNVINVKTPDVSMDIMLNRWLVYQTISCRIWARSAFYQSGGAYGFRDQLQDTMNMVFIEPSLVYNQIIACAKHQFEEGDVQHWWHPGSDKGIRTKYSDDLVWLPYAVATYVEVTGDKDILNVEVTYLSDEELKENEGERYNKPMISAKKESIYLHCVRALDRALKYGPNGIPLIGTGDWNDGMNMVGNKGLGESIWLGWFICTVIKKFVNICHLMSDEERADRYFKEAQKIVNSIEDNGWDDSWYLRAYFDSGEPLGSERCDECKIDSIAQSWAVISGLAKKQRAKEAMGAVEHYLVDRENGLIKLLTPPFDKGALNPGYIKGYVPGVRENGGQYTHAAVWVIMAFAILGYGDKAWELFNMINPVNHGRTSREISWYKVEPYVVSADVYTVQPYQGRGGWTWYTGAAGWMYKVGIEYILGLKIRGDEIRLDPCIPRSWKEYTIEYKKDAIYKITVKNPQGVSKGVKYVLVDGMTVKDKVIRTKKDGKVHNVEIIMGQ